MLCRQHHDGMPCGLAPHRYSKKRVDKKREEALRQLELTAATSEKEADAPEAEAARLRAFLATIRENFGRQGGPRKPKASGDERIQVMDTYEAYAVPVRHIIRDI